jgi:glutamate-1-semialdehyde 2,1-aminomutase
MISCFDEVMTGLDWLQVEFRKDWMCRYRIFGRVIGGGLPVGALAEQRDHGSSGFNWAGLSAGTLSGGNPLAMAAGLAMLEELDSKREILLLDVRKQLTHTCVRKVLKFHIPHVPIGWDL